MQPPEHQVESNAMRSKGGIHPYEAGILFILREKAGGGWPPRDVAKVAGWFATRLLAAQYDKHPKDVAREIIDKAMALENGQPWP